MLNEIFHEITPITLHHEDLNCMYNSIENRSPFLDKELFTSYEREIMNLTTEILNTYRKKFILKEKFQTPFYFKKIIYNLHGDYLKNKEKIKFNDIMVKLLDLDDKNLCFIMNNYNKNKQNLNYVNNESNDELLDSMELGP